MKKTLQERIKIAEERLTEMNNERKYFAEKYAETGENYTKRWQFKLAKI